MAQNEEEIITQENDIDETINDEQEQDTFEEVDEEKDELIKKVKTLEAQKDHWRKKAESKGEKKEHKEEEPKNETSLSSKEIYSLVKSGVHEDDFDDVVEYAKFKKVSVSEALKTDVVKTILSNKSEYRKTAEATNTAPARKGSTKVADEVLLKNLSGGSVPDSKEEAERLFWARRGGKR